MLKWKVIPKCRLVCLLCLCTGCTYSLTILWSNTPEFCLLCLKLYSLCSHDWIWEKQVCKYLEAPILIIQSVVSWRKMFACNLLQFYKLFYGLTVVWMATWIPTIFHNVLYVRVKGRRVGDHSTKVQGKLKLCQNWLIGDIFSFTYHTKQRNSWPTLPTTCVVIYDWLSACPGEMDPI